MKENNEKYTKYVYVTESGDVALLYGEMPDPEDRMTAEEMRFYLYDKRFRIEWKKEEPLSEDDENEVYFTILPVFSEELTPEENLDMIWTAYNYDYINGLEFLSFHEVQLRLLLGDENFEDLESTIKHYEEDMRTFYIREEIVKCVHAEKCTKEEFLSDLKETSEEEYLSVDGELFRNDGIDNYGNHRWSKYEESRNDWTNMWDVEEEEAIS